MKVYEAALEEEEGRQAAVGWAEKTPRFHRLPDDPFAKY